MFVGLLYLVVSFDPFPRSSSVFPGLFSPPFTFVLISFGMLGKLRVDIDVNVILLINICINVYYLNFSLFPGSVVWFLLNDVNGMRLVL